MVRTVVGALCAQVLALGTVHVSYALARRATPAPCPAAVRWCATAVAGLWLATAGFHLLLALGWFTLPAALIGVGLLSAATLAAEQRAGIRTWRLLQRDLRWPLRAWRVARRGRWGWLAWTVPLLALPTAVRALLLPPLGWDTVTYHGVKAASWVQEGAAPTLVAPSGWGFYRSFFGGGEVLAAWAMLPLRSDLLVGLVDATCWLLTGLAVYALCRELGVRARHAWAGTAFVVFLPALRMSVGSGYVEPALDLCVVVAVLFALRWLRTGQRGSLVLSVAALGLAVGVKPTAGPAAAVVVAVLGLSLLGRGRGRRLPALGSLIVGVVAAAVVAGPWMVRNLVETGAPLSPLPVTVAGVVLGEETDALRWHEDHPDLPAYTADAELGALRQVFRSPLDTTWPHASAASLLPLGLAPVAGLLLVRRRPWALATVGGAAAALLAGYFSPDLSVVRLLWAESNGRFLVPAIALATCLSLAGLARWRRPAGVLASVLTVAAVVHLVVGVPAGLAAWEVRALPLAAAALVLSILAAAALARQPLGARVRVAGVALLVLAAVTVLQGLDDRTWDRAVGESVVLHPRPSYWLPAAVALEDRPGGERVAVTAGPNKQADHWHLYFLLGRRLQNTLVYVPPTASGEVVDVVPFRPAPRLDPDAWLRRLGEADVTHVVAFAPASPELRWMQERPERFDLVVGAADWGLYRLDPAWRLPRSAAPDGAEEAAQG